MEAPMLLLTVAAYFPAGLRSRACHSLQRGAYAWPDRMSPRQCLPCRLRMLLARIELDGLQRFEQPLRSEHQRLVARGVGGIGTRRKIVGGERRAEPDESVRDPGRQLRNELWEIGLQQIPQPPKPVGVK